MLYAMDGRMHPCTPHLWKAWDYFGIQDAVLHGYWEADCPVQMGREDILASVYVKPGKALVALASWCQEDARVKLVIDWEKLGMRPEKAILEAAEIKSSSRPIGCKNLIQIDFLENMQEFQSHLQFLVE